MSIEKDDLHKLVDRLREQDKKSAYDFLRYLIDRQKDPYYEINQREPDDVPMNEEELEQFHDEEFVSWEAVKRGLKI
ncbi:hypothetical protein GCM10007416_09120 [Kroppenstedtia guangzhouensis]|uniref:XRE family transcriptional regulator n=1 Tax=Kroppenstedtia guangzhouensis TaxID=1274356 RepID=A0ABQ1G7S4_9BACL|nr:hypothetical protein [Kroppenstedtia guangzhouensis]GGA38390.1 hypothetical protein GCM10007416_09120 [Kroppenstedtia guangzhouensis]